MQKRLLLLAVATPLLAQNLYRVSDSVHLANPARFGVNFESPEFRPWNSSRFQNFWNDAYAMEPILFRHNGRATGGAADHLEDKKGKPVALNPQDKSSSPGSSYWDLMQDGFWDGADITVYRETENSVRLLRRGKVRRFEGNKDSEQKIYFEEPGEPVQRGDLYVLEMWRNDIPADKIAARAQHLMSGPLDAGTPAKAYGAGPVTVPWRIDPATFAPEGDSTASLRLELPGATAKGEPSGVGHQYLRFSGRELAFRAGKEYVLDVWLRQEGLNAPVLVQAGDRGKQEFSVGGEWRKYSFPLDNTRPITEGVPSLFIGSTAAGTLWIDNLLVREVGVEPFAIFPEWQQPIVDWRPGIIRSMNGRHLLHLDVQLSEGFSRKLTWTATGGLKSGGGIGLRTQLELCEKSGASPWLMTYVLPSDEELDHLMEYLGAPADVGYGRLRAAHGRERPWTEAFEHIYVEVANEMWNGIFQPQAFPGDPELCAKLSNRVFSRLKQSPHNTRANIRGMAPGWAHAIYRGKNNQGQYAWDLWTLRCARVCTEMDALATAPSGYIGGWDGQTPIGASDAELFQANLLYPAQVFEPKLDELEALRADIRASQGREFEIIKYEAGPGYSLPNPAKPFSEQEEVVGKSLALAIATLDNFLFVVANRGNTNYFLYERGNNWSSHSLNMDPHTTWLALALRNQHCRGDLLRVEEGGLQRVDIPEVQAVGLDNKGARRNNVLPAMKGIPLTRLYAFRDGKRHSFIALNRSFSQAQEITLELPYEPADAYTEYRLSHPDPRTTNRSGYNVRIAETQGTGFAKRFTFSLPPASAVVLVNEER
jgi:hypothetical protein